MFQALADLALVLGAMSLVLAVALGYVYFAGSTDEPDDWLCDKGEKL